MVKIPFNSAKLPLTNKPNPMFLINSLNFPYNFIKKIVFIQNIFIVGI